MRLEGKFNGGEAANLDMLNLGQAGEQVGLGRALVFFERPQLEMSVSLTFEDEIAKRFGAEDGKKVDTT